MKKALVSSIMWPLPRHNQSLACTFGLVLLDWRRTNSDLVIFYL